MDEDEADRAIGHAESNRDEIRASDLCGCFRCLAVFPPGRVRLWIGDGDFSALCPECGIDSVIGSASELPITAEFLTRMNQHWFGDAAGG